MKSQDYNCIIAAKISAAKAAEIINNIPAWWTEDFEGSTKNPGDMFTVRFGNIYKIFKVIEVVPGKKMVWLVTDRYLPFVNDTQEWTGTSLVWHLISEGNLTFIKMTHIGLLPAIECYDKCGKNWDFFLKLSLEKSLTGQQALPYKIKTNAYILWKQNHL